MASPKPAIISPAALSDLDNTYAWMLYRFGKPTLQIFHKKWAAFLILISTHPNIFASQQKERLEKTYPL